MTNEWDHPETKEAPSEETQEERSVRYQTTDKSYLQANRYYHRKLNKVSKKSRLIYLTLGISLLVCLV